MRGQKQEILANCARFCNIGGDDDDDKAIKLLLTIVVMIVDVKFYIV